MRAPSSTNFAANVGPTLVRGQLHARAREDDVPVDTKDKNLRLVLLGQRGELAHLVVHETVPDGVPSSREDGRESLFELTEGDDN